MLARLRLSLRTDPRLQFWLLWGFFFCAETASYLMGVLSATSLVKRAGADKLPLAYLWLNVAFLPVVLLTLARPPSSSLRAVRLSLAGYLAAVLAILPWVDSTSTPVLVTLYVFARLGKLVWSTFAVGMVAEILPLREAKKAIPSLLAAGSTGIIAAGLMLQWALAWMGVGRAFLVLWLLLAMASVLLALLGPGVSEATGERPASGVQPAAVPGKRIAYGTLGNIWTTLRRLLSEPLARVIAVQNLFVVGLRYFIEFVYARELGAHFPTEREMAGFVGIFEATLQVTTTLVQLSLASQLVRKLKVGGVALLLPAVLVATTLTASFSGTFVAVMMCQFLFWVGSDGFNKPVRQIMLGALPPSRATSVPVLMSALGMAGSVAASAALVPLAWLGEPRVVMLFTSVLSAVFLVVSLGVGRTYRRSLSETLKGLDSRGREELLAAAGDREQRYAVLAATLEAPEPELRFQAISEAAALPSAEGTALLLPLVRQEPDAKVRAAMLSALAVWRPAGLLELLTQAAKDPDPRIRANAVEALADYRDAGPLLSLVRGALEATDPRERASAVLAAIRLGSEPGILGHALDTLSEMLGNRQDARSRQAAVFVVGRLGYPFLLTALEEALDDPEPQVRGTAVEALVKLHAPMAGRILTEALRREREPALAARMREVLGRLLDDNVRAILEVQGRLTGEERARIGEMMASGSEDGRLELLRRAVRLPEEGLRSALVRLVHELKEPELLAVLGRCVPEEEGERQADLGPLLGYLEGKAAEDSPGGYDALRHLALHSRQERLEAHLGGCVGRLWRLALVAAARRDDAPAEGEITTREKRLLEHVLSVAAMMTRQPERALEVMRASLRGDRYLSSLSVELIEQWMPARLRDVLLPVLENFPDPGRRLGEARRALGVAPGSAGEAALVQLELDAAGRAPREDAR